ncbi:acyltransferase family protein [Gordonia sp. VNK21]|uniref:acyltransferase family protein n=1 Tax=Gordonia sp. VNK21 TaxID=3382483 RepID=UPI0038D4CF68
MPSRAAPASLSAAPATRSAQRRPDVEGLRGVAVLLVVVFHIWVGTVSGGVDAFLFISGFFLIPSLIRAQISLRPVDNPLPRLWRVLTRLWIPMAAVVAATVAATWYVYPSSRHAEILIDALWSDLWAVNWTLGLHGHTYADATSLPSPFQHLWSLAVQAQVFAVLIVGITLAGVGLRALGRRWTRLGPEPIRRTLIAAVLAGGLVSFGYATLVGPADQTLNYYSTFSRFWEIALGGLLGFALAGRTVPAVLRQPAGAAGLTMLVITGLVVDGATQFPGPAALLPLGGTILVFIAGTGGSSAVSAVLSTAPVVYLGTIAYHLYLWHWPVLMTYLVYRTFHATPIDGVGPADGLAIIAVSLVLAVISHRLLAPEAPRRTRRIRTPAILAGTIAALVVAVQAWAAPVPLTAADQVDWTQHPGAASLGSGTVEPAGIPFIPRVEASRADLPQTGLQGCFNDGLTNADLISCDYGAPREPGRRVLMLIGGSHAEHYLPALDAIGVRQDLTVEAVIMAGCQMAAGPSAAQSSESDHCRRWQAAAMDHVLTTRPDAVVTNSTRPVGVYGAGDTTPPWYAEAFRAFSEAGIPAVGIRDLPWLMDAQWKTRQPFDCMAVRADPIACGVPRSVGLAATDPAVPVLGGLPGVSLLDFTDLHCTRTDCPVVVGNVLVYRDAHHFTKTFMLSMTPYIEDGLLRALDWFPPAP